MFLHTCVSKASFFWGVICARLILGLWSVSVRRLRGHGDVVGNVPVVRRVPCATRRAYILTVIKVIDGSRSYFGGLSCRYLGWKQQVFIRSQK